MITVQHKVYPVKLDLAGMDLTSCFWFSKSQMAPYVGPLAPPQELESIQLPADNVTALNGEVAEEIHIFPDASQGADFKHLTLLFRNDRLIGLEWRTHGLG